jgi:hypothetical protein
MNYYSNVSNCSKCFGRHTAHHQELKKTVTAASSFTYFLVACRWDGSGIAAATGNKKRM